VRISFRNEVLPHDKTHVLKACTQGQVGQVQVGIQKALGTMSIFFQTNMWSNWNSEGIF
jgi:hypothetical protein